MKEVDPSGFLQEIKSAERYFARWRKKSKKTIQRYRDDRTDREGYGDLPTKYSSLWSIVETSRPSIYFNKPKVIVDRRFIDSDPVGRTASLILERCLSYSIDKYDFDAMVQNCLTDYFLTGRGVARVDYKSIQNNVLDPLTGVETPIIVDEYANCKYVFWDDFLHSPSRTWEDVTWVAFRSYMTKRELIERFGEEIASKINLDISSGERSNNYGDTFKLPADNDGRATIWEIWDKTKLETVWIAPGTPEFILDREQDLLGLHDFFPVCRPLYATTTTETTAPIPDYWQYQDQAIELDELTNKISQITGVLQLKGLYPGNNVKIPELLQANTGPTLIPVDDYMAFVEKGGLDRMIAWMPIERIASVLEALVTMRSLVKADLDSLSGIQSNQNTDTTATSQKIGQRLGQLRLQEKQKQVAQFLRNLLRKKAEIISEKFSPEMLLKMSGYEYMPNADPQMFVEAVKLLKNDKMRSFRIDIETDSTIALDNQDNKTESLEFVSAITGFLEKAIPAATQYPQLAPMLKEMLLFGARQFKSGRPLESVIEQALIQGEEIETPPQPSEAEIQTKGQMQLQQMKTQGDLAKTQAKTQSDLIKIDAAMRADLATQGGKENASP